MISLGERPENDSGLFTAKTMFPKGKSCKIFIISSPQDTGSEIHTHDYMQIWYVTKGICHHWIEGKEHEMVRGEAFIMPPYIAHRTQLGEDSEIICCEFSLDNFLMVKEGSSFSILKEPLLDLSFMTYFLPQQNNIKPKFALSAENQHRVEYLMRDMLREYQESPVYSEQFLRVYILELLLIFAREYYLIPYQKETSEIFNKYKSAVERAIAYINEHYAEPLTLEQVCKYSTVSKTYFCYLFKMLTHQTFVEYLLNIRIGQAMRLLETTDFPITKICYDVGFNDLTHFSRTFKKIVGVSARTYRSLKQQREIERKL